MNTKLSVLALFVVLFSQQVFADFYFSDTKPETHIKKNYSKKEVYGKDIHTVHVFPNRRYYAYVSDKDVSIFNFAPYKVLNVIVGNQAVIEKVGDPENKNVKPRPKNYVLLKAREGAKAGASSSVIVMCSGGFRANFEVIVSDRKSKRNEIVNALNGLKMAKKIDKDIRIAYLEKENQDLSDSLFHFANKKIGKYPINEEKEIDNEDSKLTLKNILYGGGSYFYLLSLEGDAKINLNTDKVFLSLKNYNNFILSKQVRNHPNIDPKRIQFKDMGASHLALIEFEIKPRFRHNTFVSKLHLADKIYFENEVNLDLSEESDDLFFSSPVDD